MISLIWHTGIKQLPFAWWPTSFPRGIYALLDLAHWYQAVTLPVVNLSGAKSILMPDLLLLEMRFLQICAKYYILQASAQIVWNSPAGEMVMWFLGFFFWWDGGFSGVLVGWRVHFHPVIDKLCVYIIRPLLLQMTDIRQANIYVWFYHISDRLPLRMIFINFFLSFCSGLYYHPGTDKDGPLVAFFYWKKGKKHFGYQKREHDTWYFCMSSIL